jgi:hypothetical protein
LYFQSDNLKWINILKRGKGHKKAGVSSSLENSPAHCAGFPHSVVYDGSNPSSMSKMADVISKNLRTKGLGSNTPKRLMPCGFNRMASFNT